MQGGTKGRYAVVLVESAMSNLVIVESLRIIFFCTNNSKTISAPRIARGPAGDRNCNGNGNGNG